MTLQLIPQTAAQIASAVYNARLYPKVEDALGLESKSLLEMFDASKSIALSGTTGVGWGQTNSFGLLLSGRGAWQGHYIIAMRGTATFADGLTDLIAAVETGPGGHLVHGGFNRCAKSMLSQLFEGLRNKNPTQIHCVGHSLGGAVANLMAAQIDAHIGGASLYTFGSPRVGQNAFAEYLTWSLGAANIQRAFNIADAVPMVPLFPYFHAPHGAGGALVGDTNGIISIGAHLMSSYAPAVAGSSWTSLRARTLATPSSIDRLLDQGAQYVKIPGSSYAFHLLGRILHALLGAIGVVVGVGVASSLTLMDRVAVALFNNIAVSKENRERVGRFLDYTAQFVGVPMVHTGAITFQFLRYMLQLLWRPIGSVVTAAIKSGSG